MWSRRALDHIYLAIFGPAEFQHPDLRVVAIFLARVFIWLMSRLTFPVFLCALLLPLAPTEADIPLPNNILEPATVPEAWNVIGLATRNVETLLDEKRPDEVATQVSLCSPSLRTLVRLASTAEEKARLDELTVRAFGFINATASGGIAKDLLRTQAGYTGLRGVLDEMAKHFDAKTVKSEIYYCPTHPEVISTEGGITCEKCNERLLPRRIPYSFVYTVPGEPTLRVTAAPDAPLEAGRKTNVKMTLAHPDGRPVLLRDLLVEHTERIHLLLVDPSLADFHREHPQPTDTPGEYVFSFTPRLTAPYRMWVDVIPAETGLVEFPLAVLPSAGSGDPITPMDGNHTSSVGGLNFRITFDDRQGTRPRAKETRLMRVTFTEQNGEPVKRLEPYMEAFAHLTGFYDDGRTIVRLHPEGGKVLRDDARGGPALGFRFYPPKAGRVRFFCEVRVDGQMIVAPLEVGIAP